MARHSSLCLALLLQLLALREGWPNVAAFVPNPTPAAFVASRTTTTTTTTTTTSLFAGDGNPPPFGDWGAPVTASTPPAPPTVYDTLPTTTYTSSPSAPASTGSLVSSVSGNDGDPMALLQASQNALVQQIQAALPDLVGKQPGASGTEDAILGPGSFLQAYDAPGAANVAWLASVYVPQRLSSLTIFNGPLTDVPHILSRCCCSVDPPNQLEVAIDIRPRAYGAYELQDPVTGEYPGPEQLGRKAFEYSGARQEYFQKFATDAIRQLLDPTQFEQATPLPQSDMDLVTGGPWALHLQMPATRHNVQRILHVRQAMGEAWLEWNAQTNHQHRPGAPVNTQYVYDSKFRQNCYLALLPYYQRVFLANDGAALAAAESGPLDEGYVGGGS